jgi:hypothetical protein
MRFISWPDVSHFIKGNSLKPDIHLVIGALTLGRMLVPASSHVIGKTAVASNGGVGAVEWRLLDGGAEMQHYSPLKQIDIQFVKRLGVAWYADVPTNDGLAGSPLVAGGVVYQSGRGASQVRMTCRQAAVEFDARIRFDEQRFILQKLGKPRTSRGAASRLAQSGFTRMPEWCDRARLAPSCAPPPGAEISASHQL